MKEFLKLSLEFLWVVILCVLVVGAGALVMNHYFPLVYCQAHGKYELQSRDCTERTSCTVSDSCCCRHVDKCSCVNPTGESCCE